MFGTKSDHYTDVSYEARNDQKFYFRLAEATFKESYSNNKQEVTHIKYQDNMELTK